MGGKRGVSACLESAADLWPRRDQQLCTSVHACGRLRAVTQTSSDDVDLVRRFGRVVKARREQLNLSQAELAGLIGRPAGTVAQIEQGRRKTGPSGRTLVALDAALRWSSGSARETMLGGEPVELRPVPPGVGVYEPEPGLRILLDELNLTPPDERARVVAALVAVARSLRDQQSQ